MVAFLFFGRGLISADALLFDPVSQMMHVPTVSLRLRRLRRRFGISAPRVVVRTHWSWRWLVAGGAIALWLLISVVWLVMQRNEVGAMGREISELHRQLDAQREELVSLRATAGTGQSAVAMERAAQQQLLSRLENVERENAALKEDIRVFERLVPSATSESRLSVESFRFVPEGQGRHRYRLLLAFQPEKQGPEFRGRLQFLVVYTVAGKEAQRLFPEGKEAAPEYQLEVRHFLRREGVVDLPVDAVVKSVEARILHGEMVRVRHMAQL